MPPISTYAPLWSTLPQAQTACQPTRRADAAARQTRSRIWPPCKRARRGSNQAPQPPATQARSAAAGRVRARGYYARHFVALLEVGDAGLQQLVEPRIQVLRIGKVHCVEELILWCGLLRGRARGGRVLDGRHRRRRQPPRRWPRAAPQRPRVQPRGRRARLRLRGLPRAARVPGAERHVRSEPLRHWIYAAHYRGCLGRPPSTFSGTGLIHAVTPAVPSLRPSCTEVPTRSYRSTIGPSADHDISAAARPEACGGGGCVRMHRCCRASRACLGWTNWCCWHCCWQRCTWPAEGGRPAH